MLPQCIQPKCFDILLVLNSLSPTGLVRLEEIIWWPFLGGDPGGCGHFVILRRSSDGPTCSPSHFLREVNFHPRGSSWITCPPFGNGDNGGDQKFPCVTVTERDLTCSHKNKLVKFRASGAGEGGAWKCPKFRNESKKNLCQGRSKKTRTETRATPLLACNKLVIIRIKEIQNTEGSTGLPRPRPGPRDHFWPSPRGELLMTRQRMALGNHLIAKVNNFFIPRFACQTAPSAWSFK